MKKAFRPLFALVLIAVIAYGITLIPHQAADATTASTSIENNVPNISASEAQALISKDKDVIVLDIRTAQEFSQGHIEKAINIDYYASDFAENIAELSPDKTYIIYCRSGSRSGSALPVIKDAGLTNIFHLNKGFNEWKKEGNPIAQP